MPDQNWIDAGATDELAAGGAKLLRHEGRQYALFRDAEGGVYACDNACPHEGYPLIQGYTDGCLLTCAWHNFKFDLRSGECVVGEEDLGVYPVREIDGRLQIDPTPRQGPERESRLWGSLETALHQDRLAQAARDAARLLELGVPPGRIAAFAAHFDARHAPWGSTHALPVAADLLRYFDREDEDPLPALLPVLELAAESGHLRPPHPRAEPAPESRSRDGFRARLLEAVEKERFEDAERALREAAARGLAFDALEAMLLEACCEHFLDFGHPLIYLTKLPLLRPHCVAELRLEILVGLLREIVYATREDTLPPMAATRKSLERHRGEFPAWMARQSEAVPLDEGKRRRLREVLLDGRTAQVPETIHTLLDAGVDRAALARELVLIAAERMLRFDPGIEMDSGVRENWLHVTHTLTYASAVREVLAGSEAPHTLALLFHAAHFIHHKQPLDTEDERELVPAPVTNASPDADAIVTAVLLGDREEALARARFYVERRGVDAALVRAVEDLALRHGAVRPIRAAHVLKTLVVGLEESRDAKDDPRAFLPLAAALAFAAAPMQERALARVAREAGEFVREGRPPRRLTR